MRKIVHIIDRHTPLDMLEQLFTLRNEDEPVVSLGPPPDLSLIAGVKGVKVHPLTNSQFPGREKASLPSASLLHVWGEQTFATAVKCKNSDSTPFVLSLGHLPQTTKRRDALSGWIRSSETLVTVPTRCAMNNLLRDGGVSGKIAVLPPAVKPYDDSVGQVRKNIREKVRKSLGISDADKLVVVPAEMQRQAGHKLASWAHAIVEQLVDGCKIVFPGGGEYERSVRFFSNTTGYPDDIFFTGNRFSIRDVLCAADIATFFYRRDCGVTILAQTMLTGLVILAATTPDILSICRHEDNALLAAPDDPREASAALLRVVDDNELGKRLGQNAAEFAASNFDSIKIRRKLDEIYTTREHLNS